MMSPSRYGAVRGFDDMAETSTADGEAAGMFWEDFLDLSAGVDEMFDELPDSANSGNAGAYTVEDVVDSNLKAYALMDDLNYEPTRGLPFQSPPRDVDSVANTGRSDSALEAVAVVTVVQAPELGYGAKKEWEASAATVLPNDILIRVPRKKGEGKYFASGQKYKPCSWEKFIELVNLKVSTGKLKVISKRPKRRRRIRNPEEVADPLVVAKQALEEIYGEYFDASSFWALY